MKDDVGEGAKGRRTLTSGTPTSFLSTVGRASSPSRHGQDARATRCEPGAQASSLCGTGKMPVLPHDVL
jgi:hypothetical protein